MYHLKGGAYIPAQGKYCFLLRPLPLVYHLLKGAPGYVFLHHRKALCRGLYGKHLGQAGAVCIHKGAVYAEQRPVKRFFYGFYPAVLVKEGGAALAPEPFLYALFVRFLILYAYHIVFSPTS